MKSPFVHLHSREPDRPQEGIISGWAAFFPSPGDGQHQTGPGLTARRLHFFSLILSRSGMSRLHGQHL